MSAPAPRGAGLPGCERRAEVAGEPCYPSDSPAVRAAATTLARCYPSMRAAGRDMSGSPRPDDRAYLIAWRVVSAAAPYLRTEAFDEAIDLLAGGTYTFDEASRVLSEYQSEHAQRPAQPTEATS